MEFETNEDIAGKGYWNKTWGQANIPKIIDPHNKSVRNVIKLALDEFFHKIFNMCLESTNGKQLIEVGCGNSKFLPYMSKEFGFNVSGLDYSEIGCEMTRKAAMYYGVEMDVFLCDLFEPTYDLREKYDVVFAHGVIEHFTETYKPCKAMADLAGKDGIVINIVPNFSPGSLMGRLQKRYAPDIYDKHMPLDREEMIQAHEQAGLKTLYCEYLLACNYGVINFGGKHNLAKVYYIIKGMIKMFLKRDKLTGTKKYAPYIVYVGQKSADTDLV